MENAISGGGKKANFLAYSPLAFNFIERLLRERLKLFIIFSVGA